MKMPAVKLLDARLLEWLSASENASSADGFISKKAFYGVAHYRLIGY